MHSIIAMNIHINSNSNYYVVLAIITYCYNKHYCTNFP